MATIGACFLFHSRENGLFSAEALAEEVCGGIWEEMRSSWQLAENAGQLSRESEEIFLGKSVFFVVCSTSTSTGS